MTMTAPVPPGPILTPTLALAALARFAAGLPLPGAAAPTAATPTDRQRAPDVVVFSSAPFRLLSDLAAAGLRQLTALLPALEQALQQDAAAPLGHLAKAAGAAARQITEGHLALLAEGPERVAASLRGELPGPTTTTPNPALQSVRTMARQLGTSSVTEPTPDSAAPDPQAPDAHTTETLRAIARQIGTAERLPLLSTSDPDASPIQRWLGQADQALRSTADALGRAEQLLTTLPQTNLRQTTQGETTQREITQRETNLREAALHEAPLHEAAFLQTAPASPSVWALAQVAAAQLQVATAYGSLARSLRQPSRLAPATAARSVTLPGDHLAGATTMFGMLLVLATLWLAGGLWSLVTGTAGLVAVGFWVMRISRASSGTGLDVRR